MSDDELNELIEDCRKGAGEACFREEKNDYLDLVEDIEIEIADRTLQRAHEDDYFQLDALKIRRELFMPADSLMISIFDLENGNLLKEAERELISQCLKQFGGNRTKTAKALGISIRTLRNKLNEYRDNKEMVISYV